MDSDKIALQARAMLKAIRRSFGRGMHDRTQEILYRLDLLQDQIDLFRAHSTIAGEVVKATGALVLAPLVGLSLTDGDGRSVRNR